MRVVIGGLSHETSTFTPIETTLESFEGRFLLRGNEIVRKFAGTNSPLGGMIEGLERAEAADIVPTLFAEAHPSGTIPADVFHVLVDEFIAGIVAALPVDGVLLDLHGAMVAESAHDADGFILARVREAVGPDVPVVVQLDIHANVSEAMAANASVLVGRRTYPETDMGERGVECVEVLCSLLAGEPRPTTSFRRLPFAWGINQVTAHEPMRGAIELLDDVRSRPGVLSASISTGFPYSDVPDMGASVRVTTIADSSRAEALCDELATWIVARRAGWHSPLPSTAAALRQAEADGAFPVVFADREDNTGSGTPGDSTGMLRAFVDADLESACILYIVDPDVAERCIAAGVGSKLELALGGASDAAQGPPVLVCAEIVATSATGSFIYDGPMYAGLAGSMGPSAHIRHRGVRVLVVSEREQPFDVAFARTLALDPRQMRYIGVKSQTHFRAGFESWVGSIHVVREPSVHCPPGGELIFTRARSELLYAAGMGSDAALA